MAIELLAPAKDLACGIAALDCGADAVYIGAARFGARGAAGNSLADIAALVAHAHRYWARVYVTLNTLLFDEELPPAVELAHALYDQGIDGLIIQDMGLLECALPPVPLIASTQMHNTTPARVAFLGKVGFSRAILARELSLDEIRAIRQATDIALECFVHGALCVCYSGQCYLSYALGGRSGNRGQCAQPCRKPYVLRDGHGAILTRDGHPLSLRDLNLSAYLGELLDVGVTSFKIEGRLKDQAYVMNVVRHYREQLDAQLAVRGLARSSSGVSRVDFTPDVEKTFNRGYTRYFLLGRGEPVGSVRTPKMVGELLGPVTALTPAGIAVNTAAVVQPGDGVCYFTREGELRGTAVNSLRGSALILEKVVDMEVGTLLYRNHDHVFLTRLGKCRAERGVDVTFSVREAADGLLVLARDEDGVEAEYLHPCTKEPATKPEQALLQLDAQLRKCGGTPYTCQGVEITLPTPYFLPISALNALRRGVLERLTETRERHRPRESGGARINDVPYPANALTFEGNVLNRQAHAFYTRHGVATIEPGAETGLSLHNRRVMTTRHCLLQQYGFCVGGKRVRPIAEPLTLHNTEGQVLELRCDCRACRMEVWLK